MVNKINIITTLEYIPPPKIEEMKVEVKAVTKEIHEELTYLDFMQYDPNEIQISEVSKR